MSEEKTYRSIVTLARGYKFVAEFPDLKQPASILFDEPPPLGDNHGPNAAAVLGAAVGNCLGASLTFCLRKARAELDGMTAVVMTHVARNESGKFRISGIDVELVPAIAGEPAKLERCEALFEDFCTVTESVRRGIPVNVSVRESAGAAVSAAK